MWNIKCYFRRKRPAWVRASVVAAFLVPFMHNAYAGDIEKAGDQAQVMQSFQQQEEAKQQPRKLSDDKKHRIMFLLGVPLLLILLIAAGLGISMAVYGKRVFVLHMIFAALGVTLAIVHSIVGLVWFNPF